MTDSKNKQSMRISFSALSAHQNIKKQDGKYLINVIRRDDYGPTRSEANWLPLDEIISSENSSYRVVVGDERGLVISSSSEFIPGASNTRSFLTDVCRVYKPATDSIDMVLFEDVPFVREFIEGKCEFEVNQELKYDFGNHSGEVVDRAVCFIKNLHTGEYVLARKYLRSDGVLVAGSTSCIEIDATGDIPKESRPFRVAATMGDMIALGYEMTHDGFFIDRSNPPSYVRKFIDYVDGQVQETFGRNGTGYYHRQTNQLWTLNYINHLRDITAYDFFYVDNENDIIYTDESQIPFVEKFSYHSKERISKVHKDGFTVGFEIEKEDSFGHDMICANRLYMNTRWIKERDGSLDENIGYELVSPTYNLMRDDIFHDINASNELRQAIDADYTTSCGGHIHIGHTELSGKAFFNEFSSWIPLFYSLYVRRINKEHCRIKKNEDIINDNDHYQSVVIFDDHIELRIPSAVPSYATLTWRIELLRHMCSEITMSPMRIAQDMLNKKSKLYKILSRQYDEKGIMEKLRLYTFFANRLLTFDGGKISEENLDYSLFTQSEINLLKRRGIYE
jgi:hypothetical protein